MKITKDQVEHIAKLARLGLKEEEKEKFADQLSSILNYVEQLSEISTTNTESTAYIEDLENVTREDKVEPIEEEKRKALLRQAPALEDDLVKTKAVF